MAASERRDARAAPATDEAPAREAARGAARDAAPPASSWRRRARWLRDHYGVADPRTLGLARIVVGLLLAADCIRHWSVARVYYSNDGVLTNHFHLYRPSGEFNFSLFHAFSSPAEVNVAFALALTCHLLFAIGYRARLFAILSSVWVASLDNRLVMVENGGYVVVNLLIFWLCFLPTGQRFGVDSLRRSWAERRERSIADLDAPLASAWLTEPRTSLAAFALIANLLVIYVFNLVNKYGDTWRTGATVHYVLHLDRMVTGLAVFLREHTPYVVTQVMTWLVLVVEALLVVTIAWPRRRLIARPLAMALMFGVHGTFGVMMRLGPFSWFLIGWSTLLLTHEHWAWLEARHRERVGRLVVLLPPDSALGLLFGRVLRRLDTPGCLRVEALQPALLDGRELPYPRAGSLLAVKLARGPQAAAETVAVSAAEASGASAVLVGPAACLAVLGALPLGNLAAWVLRVALLGLHGAAFRLVESRAEAIARFFGLPSPLADAPPADAPPAGAPHAGGPPPRSPLALGVARSVSRAREAALACLLLASASQLVNENKSIPKVLHHKPPRVARAALGYPRLFQGWGMFSPNPVREDGIAAVDGYTIDGRRVDPFTGREPDLNLADARGLGLGQIEQDYFNRIRLDRNRAYHKPLSEYLANWHLRTGNPKDQLVAFDVYWLEDDCPAPRSLTPTNHRSVCLISWRKPGHKPKGDGPRPPAKCKETSAGK